MVLFQRSRKVAVVVGATSLAAAALAGFGSSAGAATSAAPPPRPSQAQSKAFAADSASSLVAGRPSALHASKDDKFTAKPVISEQSGLQYVPYERSYKGLPVVGGDFVVVTDAKGAVKYTSVAQTTAVPELSTTAKVTPAAAQKTAAKQLKKVDSSTTPTLAVYALNGTPRLVWQSRVSGNNGHDPSSLSVYVDAQSGKVLGTKEHVMAGNGTAAYSGPSPVHLDTTLSGSTYSMKDPNTTNQSCQDAANNTTFSGPDDNWGNGNATSRETGCVDALFTAQTERHMLTDWLGRNGFDGNGGGWPIRVGLADVNAYYDGTQVQVGHNNAGQWIGSMDVVGHELGHGIDDHTPGGISGSGTQEFVADTFGAATEWYSNQASAYDPPDFYVGEEVNLVGNGPIRNMYDPSQVGDPSCYSSSVPGSEVHAAAGPGDHWFVLLSQGSGGSPNVPTCNSSSVTGLGIQKAIRIMYNAMLMKTSSSSYLKYRTWTLTAAKNLYPGSCTEFNTVKAAWDAVSVPAQTADPTCSTSGGVTVTNPGNKTGTVGTAISPFTLTASGGTAPYTWSASGLPAGITIGSSTGTVSGTPTASGTFNVTATATASAGGSGSTSFTFTIGGTGGCSGQKLGNPGFETGTAAPWSASSGVIDNSTSQPAHGGTWKAWLDGYGSTHTDTLSQSVAIPAGCSATLSFYLHIDSAETTTSTQYDKLTVKAGSTTLATYSNLNKASGYSLKSFNLSSFAGQTVSISFTGTEDSSLQTSFVIDDTGLNLS
ncbi:Zn-dependent metalloprotease [Kribbella sp. VKM Ac-2571]|uniref:M4 family metallopeptidase n=1 Tax=Kribbella sp. VKM Ac-2571 TaxID=2512222 RepID=UPI0010601202|nr:M4 family metallopeptidase [Kribbella sp. VKM Ac-2571]TDO48902.1 Zn-dependent metalloprotease [Kribbella sp. VKM Ac-2571]